jgi:predicted dehydrogenase
LIRRVFEDLRNWSTNKPINQSTSHPINQSPNKPINQSPNQPVNKSLCQQIQLNMKNDNQSSRRKFLQKIAATSLAAATSPLTSLVAQEKAEERILRYDKKISSADKIRIGVIGYGVQGHFDLSTALQVPGVELAGICDLYTGRLENAKELHGKDLFTTRNYKDLLDRTDIDAVIIAVTDIWHARITIDALAKGKHVYCEKPMIYKIKEGYQVIEAQKKYNKVLQVGSQRVSSIGYAKAKELLAAGEIGKLNMVNAVYDRQSSIGSWEYTIPKDANPNSVDWERFIEATGKMEYDAKKFFWWRAYNEVGTGVAGDLFIHLLSGSHFITNSLGPETIYSTGQISHWKDGRNMPDVMSGVMQYPDAPEHPAFQMTLQVNFISGTGGQEVIRLVGSEGIIDVMGNDITVKHSLVATILCLLFQKACKTKCNATMMQNGTKHKEPAKPKQISPSKHPMNTTII